MSSLGRWLLRVHLARKAANQLRRKAMRLCARRNGYPQYLVLDELLETEYRYGRDLRIIVEYIQTPLSKAQLIVGAEEAELFSCLPQLIKMSDMMLDELRRFERTWEPVHACIGPKMHAFLMEFRIYNEYRAFSEQSKGKTRGEQILTSVERDPRYQRIEREFNQAVRAELKRFGIPSGGTYKFDTYLLKPTQRIARYKLFLQRYQKLLPPAHKEKQSLLEIVHRFDATVQSYQDKLNSQEQMRLYNHLSKLYQPIVGVNSTRRLLEMFESHNLQEQALMVYIFTDMVLLTRQVQGKEKMAKVVQLDETSFVYVFPDGKHIDKVLLICGNCECCELRFSNAKMLADIAVKIDRLILDLLEKERKRKRIIQSRPNSKPQVKFTVLLAENRIQHLYFLPNFKVTVEGVQSRTLSQREDAVYYVLRLALQRPYLLCQYIYCKYSMFERIEEFVKKRYPQVILPRLKPSGSLFHPKKHQSMALQFRSIMLTSFLNVILRCNRIMANPIFIIDELHIDEALWDFAVEDKDKPCKCDSCSYCAVPPQGNFVDQYLKLREYYLKKAPYLTRQAYCLRNSLYLRQEYLSQPISYFNSYSKILLYLQYKQARVDEAFVKRRKEKQQYPLTVAMIHPEGQTVELSADRNTTAGDILRQVCRQMQHPVWFDYALFIDYMEVPRQVDNDELVLDTLQQLESSFSSSTNLLDRLKEQLSGSKHWSSELRIHQTSRFYVRKYLFLSPQLQTSSYRQNQIRLRWIVEQAFESARSGQVRLESQPMVEMVCCFLFLTHQGRLRDISASNFPNEELSRVLPPTTTHSFESQQMFVHKVVSEVQLMLTKKPSSSQVLLRVVELVSNEITWYTSLYRVMPYDSYSKGKQAFVGVNHNNFVLIEDGTVYQWPLLEVKYKVTAYSIFLDVSIHSHQENSTDARIRRFDGPMLFNLEKLAQRYRVYHSRFLKGRTSDMGRDILANRVSC